jgi:hypothetical protein
MIRAFAGKPTLIPEVTELLEREEAAALIEAFIDQRCFDDVKQELRAKAKAAGDNDQVDVDIVWIKEEIAFALGVAIGRRLGGA